MTDMTPEQQLTSDLEKAIEDNFSPEETEAVTEEVTEEVKEPAAEENAKESEAKEPVDSADTKDGDGEKQPEVSGVVEETDTDISEDETEDLLTVSESWSKEDRAIFDEMEPDAQQILLQQSKNLEKGFTRKSMKRADDLKSYEDIVSLYSGMEVQLNQAGLNPVTATQRLVGTQQMLMQNPEAGLRQLMTEYSGGDLKGIVTRMATDLGISSAADDGQAQYDDPQLTALKGEVSAMKQAQAQQAQATQTQYANELQNQISLFEGATDDKGNKLHPHFNDVRNVMGALITSGASPDMDHAYKAAVQSSDAHFDALVNDRITAAQKTANAKRKKKVEQSKDAGFNVKSNKAPANGRDKRANLDDAIRDSMSKHTFG